ncbi:MAG: L,D-transpeptidase [Gammaproteobacteria bacterium]
MNTPFYGFTGPVRTMISHRFLPLILSILLVMPADAAANRDRDIWILVDTQAMVLSVLEGNRARRTYNEIAIGRAGTTQNKVSGDSKTPLGDFRLVRIAPSDVFHRFLGIDYPTLAHAERGLRAGTIGREHYNAIQQALKAKAIPPQETPLGGYIGIHGVGAGDPAVHQNFNWTQGCIALTNRQIDDLSKWVYLGMRVVIR